MYTYGISLTLECFSVVNDQGAFDEGLWGCSGNGQGIGLVLHKYNVHPFFFFFLFFLLIVSLTIFGGNLGRRRPRMKNSRVESIWEMVVNLE